MYYIKLLRKTLLCYVALWKQFLPDFPTGMRRSSIATPSHLPLSSSASNVLGPSNTCMACRPEHRPSWLLFRCWPVSGVLGDIGGYLVEPPVSSPLVPAECLHHLREGLWKGCLPSETVYTVLSASLFKGFFFFFFFFFPILAREGSPDRRMGSDPSAFAKKKKRKPRLHLAEAAGRATEGWTPERGAGC